MIRSGRGFARGSCGELVQGVTTGGEAFQVSLPVALGTTVTAWFEASDEVEVGGGPAAAKLAAGVAATLDLIGAPPQRVRVRKESDLPVGKGMASSTADIVAAARATAAAFGVEIGADELAELAGAIEPSDGSMYPRTALLRRRGTALRRWPWTPAFTAVVLVPSTTTATDDVAVECLARAGGSYDRIVADLERSAATHDRRGFLAAAAASARIHHELVGNRWSACLPRLAEESGAIGWNVAHTGPAAGLLFEATPAGRRAALAAAPRLGEGLAVRTIVTSAG
ncbi:MAG: GHMP family kinase ATP-binding protein [Actinomycetota bacterium]